MKSLDVLKNNENLKNEDNPKRKYFCKTCDLNFEDKTCFKKHEVRYHGEIKYNCDKCEKDFHLCNHKATHARPEHDDLPPVYSFDALKSTSFEHSGLEEVVVNKKVEVNSTTEEIDTVGKLVDEQDLWKFL